MKVIICGAGQVGWQIARFLSNEGNNVTVVDKEHSLVARATETLDVNGVTGFASYPDVLRMAGAQDADMLIAATHSDEVNMVTCQIAHSIFNIRRKIARLRAQSYLDAIYSDIYQRDHLPIDVVISPEVEVAKAAVQLISTASSFDASYFLNDDITMLGLEIDEDCPVINTPLRQLTELFSTLFAYVAGFRREGRLRVADATDQLYPNDQVYIFTRTGDVARTLEIFGKDQNLTERILIFGGGNIGCKVARSLEKATNRAHLRVIEKNRSQAEQTADVLEKTIVLHGDALDLELLHEANISNTDAVLAVTDDDKTNLLAATRAKTLGAKMAVSLINEASYSDLGSILNIDAFLNPRGTTVSSILRHIRTGRVHRVYAIGDNEAEASEIEVLQNSKITLGKLSEINFPENARVVAIKRDGQIQRPSSEMRLETGDIAVIFAHSSVLREVEDLFRVDIGYF